MLELQLAMMMDLPARMNPGLFVVASDCLEFFNSEGDWSLTNPGFTAFAHPSPIIIGTTHGVFVLSDHKVHFVHEFFHIKTLGDVWPPRSEAKFANASKQSWLKWKGKKVHSGSTYSSTFHLTLIWVGCSVWQNLRVMYTVLCKQNNQIKSHYIFSQ